MDKLQEENIDKNTKNFLLLVHSFNFLLLLLNFALNFLGEPSLKYVYLVQVIFIFFSVAIFRFNEIFFELLILFFIEGQGRVLWEYQSWARIVFDVITLLSILKIFIIKRKILSNKVLPWPIVVFISLHFFWYIIQIFNLNSASMFGAVGASKIYIFPILLFLAIILSDVDIYNKDFKLALNLLIFIIFMEIALSIYQVKMKQSLLLGMSSYYYKAMKNGVFVDMLFRPFATTQLPGAISVFLFLTAGFLYLRKFSTKGYILKVTIMIATCYTIIACQVRSALVKYLLIIGLIHFGKMFYQRFKLSTVLPVFIIAFSLIIGANAFFSNTDSSGDENLDYAKARISSLKDVSKVKGDRLNIEDFSQIITDKISAFPLGIGPGSTGPAASLSKEDLTYNPLVTEEMLWTSDNLLIALAIDLGIGAIFYIFIVLFIPLYFIRYLLVFYAKKMENHYTTVLVCASSLVVIIIGNWGALGLTYNPESFIFWFFAAVGFKTIGQYKNASMST